MCSCCAVVKLLGNGAQWEKNWPWQGLWGPGPFLTPFHFLDAMWWTASPPMTSTKYCALPQRRYGQATMDWNRGNPELNQTFLRFVYLGYLLQWWTAEECKLHGVKTEEGSAQSCSDEGSLGGPGTAEHDSETWFRLANTDLIHHTTELLCSDVYSKKHKANVHLGGPWWGQLTWKGRDQEMEGLLE